MSSSKLRVHGNKKISRRKDVSKQNNYNRYESILKEDFHNMCGYCGKTQHATSKGFEIDHFIPNKIAEEHKNNYYNLVYSCYTCNRKKSSKWPTNNKKKHICHERNIGIIDPVCDSFDENIYRKPCGTIEGKTELGKYVCEKIFKFNIRPTREIWLLSQISENTPTPEEYREYVKINKLMKELRDIIFNKKE